MKLYAVLDNGFYAGNRLLSEEDATQTECTSLQPTGLLLDEKHCPRLVRGKRDIQWVDDSSEDARAAYQKHHLHVNPFSFI